MLAHIIQKTFCRPVFIVALGSHLARFTNPTGIIMLEESLGYLEPLLLDAVIYSI